MEGNRPPTPPPLTPPPGDWEQPPAQGGVSEPTHDPMQDIADKVGLVPNLRKADNVFQLWFVLIGIALGTLCFALIVRDAGFIAWIVVGGGLGMIVGVVVSGAILAVSNLRR